jgi:hypothetical protein
MFMSVSNKAREEELSTKADDSLVKTIINIVGPDSTVDPLRQEVHYSEDDIRYSYNLRVIVNKIVDRKCDMAIYCMPDDWFYAAVRQPNKNYYTYYKCDQVDGLTDMIKKEMNYYQSFVDKYDDLVDGYKIVKEFKPDIKDFDDFKKGEISVIKKYLSSGYRLITSYRNSKRSPWIESTKNDDMIFIFKYETWFYLIKDGVYYGCSSIDGLSNLLSDITM